MKKIVLIIGMLMIYCSMPMYSEGFTLQLVLNAEDADGPIGEGPPIGKSKPVEITQAEIFDCYGTMVYKGMAYIISGNLVINTTGWSKGSYTAYVTAQGEPDRVFTIICE